MLHTDAVQAACWLDLRTITPHVDLMSLSAHKFGGPKGVGVLVARGRLGVRAAARRRRSGARAAQRHAQRRRDRRHGRRRCAPPTPSAPTRTSGSPSCATRSSTACSAELDDVHETVDRVRKVAGSAHVCIDGIENEALLYLLDEAGVCASAASSCASGAMEPSHVLAAMGVPDERARGALRLTLGRTTTADDIDRRDDSDRRVPSAGCARDGAA